MKTSTLPSGEKPLSALVVDDESRARKNLSQLLQKYCSGIQVCGEASTLAQATDKIHDLKPDVLFQDICMPGTLGLEYVEQMPQPAPQVVFVTAYNHYALRALKAGAVDYLLKPLRVDELQKATEKLVHKHRQNRIPDASVLIKNFFEQYQNQQLEKIALPTQGRIEIVSLNDIIYIESDNSYSTVFTTTHNITVCKSIRVFEEILAPQHFFRIHNSYLINLRYITTVDIHDSTAHLKGSYTLPVAKRRLKELKEMVTACFCHF